MKFRKKPVVIEAVQFLPDDPKCVGEHGELLIPGLEYEVDSDLVIVQTLEGPLYVSPGDWIITGTKGEIYPCKPDVFAEVYEPVVS